MRLAFGLCLLVACKGSGDDYGVIPGMGGPTGGSGGAIDAPSTIDGNGTSFVGVACLLQDPRDATSCAPSGAGNITVKIGTATATTADNGSFTIAAPAGTNLAWSLTGTDIVPSIVPFSANHSIPVISIARYQQLQSDNGVVISDQTASVFARVIHTDAPVTAATATVSPPTITAAYYDGVSATAWDQNATHAFGVVWFPELDLSTGATTASVTITKDAASTKFDGIPLRDLTITFVTLGL